MPQMAPMWWATLLISFSVSLLAFSIMNFSISLSTINFMQNETLNMKLNWKW